MDEDLNLLFLKIIEDNKQKILRICQAYSQNRENQKDLYQEVVLNIWKSLPTFRQEAMIHTWVYRVCLNVCMRFSIKSKKENLAKVPIEGIHILDESGNLQKNLEHNEKIKGLYSCISQLNDAEKSLVLLFLEDLSYKAISDIIGISENHVAVKLNRIKKKLFHCINN